MPERKARNVGPAGIEIAYERFGAPDAPPVLLITGAGGQLVTWPEGFCQTPVDRGLQVIRFDTRDSGRSTHFPDAPVPDFPAAQAGDLSSAPYSLSDLAADTVGLLDALGLDGAHLVGSSMGGMIAQMVAIEHPERARSLTTMMSTTGEPGVGEADFSVFAELASLERAAGLAEGTTATVAFAPETDLPLLLGEITKGQWVESIVVGLAGQVPQARARELGTALAEAPFRADDVVVAMLLQARAHVPLVLVTNATVELEEDLLTLGPADFAP